MNPLVLVADGVLSISQVQFLSLLVRFELVKCNDHLVQLLLLVVDVRLELLARVESLVVLRLHSGQLGLRVHASFDYLD